MSYEVTRPAWSQYIGQSGFGAHVTNFHVPCDTNRCICSRYIELGFGKKCELVKHKGKMVQVCEMNSNAYNHLKLECGQSGFGAHVTNFHVPCDTNRCICSRYIELGFGKKCELVKHKGKMVQVCEMNSNAYNHLKLECGQSGLYSGFGAVSPPAGFDTGKPWLYCGSEAATLQMLHDLGFSGSIASAMSAYMRSKGMSTGSVTSAACQALLADWTTKQTAGSATSQAAQAATAQQGGQQVVVAGEPSMTDKAKAWWGGLSTPEKVGVGVGGFVAVGALFWLLIPSKGKSMPVKSYKSDVEYTTGTKPEETKATGATPNPKGGRRLPRVKGKPFGHHIAPKKYRKLGFTKPGHYAWPYGYSYPIGDAKHTRLASQRFSMHKSRYPKFVRDTIARRINTAKKYFGIAEYRVAGKKRKSKKGRGKVQFAVRRAA